MEPKVLLFSVQRITVNLLREDLETPGLLALAGFLETKGYDALIYKGEPASVKEFLENQIQAKDLLAVGFYCHYENQFEVAALSAEITEEYALPVILGGPQVGGFDAAYLQESRCLAAVCGEGEITLWRLLESLSGKGGDWRDIDGIIYADEHSDLVRTPPGPIVENLDDLPLPAFHKWVNKPILREIHVMTGRGCPFNCAFCHEGSLSRPVRLRSIKNVLKEVETLLANEPEAKYIFFTDDTFVLSPKRVRAFCEGLSGLREKRDFAWFCEGHANLLDRWPDLLSEMTKAGMIRLQIGVESGVAKVLEIYGKQTTQPQIERVVKACFDSGVHQVVGAFITGGPFESEEIVSQNMAFCDKLIELAPGVAELGPSPLTPYPDTAIARDPKKYGIRIIDGKGITAYSDYPVTETATMNREQIARAQKELIEHEIQTMHRVFKQGKVSHERILNSFVDFSYGAMSLWYLAVYSKIPFLKGYYTLLARGAVSRSNDIPPEDLAEWRPQRILEMWHDVGFSEGYPRIGKEVLSPLEFEILLYATGKLRLNQVLDRVYHKFSTRFKDRDGFEAMAADILKTFEERYWLAYAPL
jgi:radical SAM superfamily enzyme YgiQ (UPF0313 family)